MEDELERRKKLILANWNLLSESTKDLLKSIGIDGEKKEEIMLKQHRSKGSSIVAYGGNIMKWLALVIALLLVAIPVVYASNFSAQPSAEDKATFDQILTPVLKVYNLVKYATTVIAVLVLLFAGIMFMMGGNDPKHKDTAKAMATYVIIGLVVIWAAPIVVSYVTG